MTIFFDCTPIYNWEGHPTGIQRVVQELTRSLLSINISIIPCVLDSGNEFFFYDVPSKLLLARLEFEKGDIFFTAGPNWDLTSHNLILSNLKQKGVKIVLLVYDLIPIKFPYMYGPGFSSIYQEWLSGALQFVDHFICISQNTKRDLEIFIRDFRYSYSKISVIRLGDGFTLDRIQNFNQTKICAKKPFIISVGTLEIRKNHHILLDAYRLLCEKKFECPKLYIIGKRGWLDNDLSYQIMNDFSLKSHIEILYNLNDYQLTQLYKDCLFTLYPAIYEGWGLPVAESLSHGKQCIVSNTSSMLEIAPDLTRFAHPYLAQEWAQNIYQLVTDSEALLQEEKQIVIGYVKTSWDQTASNILHIFDII